MYVCKCFPELGDYFISVSFSLTMNQTKPMLLKENLSHVRGF